MPRIIFKVNNPLMVVELLNVVKPDIFNDEIHVVEPCNFAVPLTFNEFRFV